MKTMKQTLTILFLLFLLVLTGFSSMQASAPVQDPAEMRPEDYLPTIETLPQTLLDKYPRADFRLRTQMSKMPNYYKARVRIEWGADHWLETEIEVGVPGYWQGYDLRSDNSYESVRELDNLGDYAYQLQTGFYNEIRFIKGNSIVSVGMKTDGASNLEDVQTIAWAIFDQLPEEMPHPDSWSLIVPGPVEPIEMPSKYIYKVYGTGEPNVFNWDCPGCANMRMITRYPFNEFTMGMWSQELQAYILVDEKHLGIYGTVILNSEHGPEIYNVPLGDYELHYWVHGELAAIYPFSIQ